MVISDAGKFISDALHEAERTAILIGLEHAEFIMETSSSLKEAKTRLEEFKKKMEEIGKQSQEKSPEEKIPQGGRFVGPTLRP